MDALSTSAICSNSTFAHRRLVGALCNTGIGGLQSSVVTAPAGTTTALGIVSISKFKAGLRYLNVFGSKWRDKDDFCVVLDYRPVIKVSGYNGWDKKGVEVVGMESKESNDRQS